MSNVEPTTDLARQGKPTGTASRTVSSVAPSSESRSARKTALAFAMVYLFWGSTFLGVRYAVETIPPLLAVGARQILAGVVLFPIARLRTKEKTSLRHWISGAFVGALLIGGGNGSIAWAEARHTPTNITAILVATVPLWMAILDWLRPGGTRPTGRIVIALAVGLTGVGLLVSPNDPFLHTSSGTVTPACAVVLFAGSICWAVGSIFSRHIQLPQSPLLGTSIFAIMGGVTVCLMGIANGEGSQLHISEVSNQSILATFYLAIFGTILGFSAYTYLLRVVPAARVATYAYINPVIAVFLGWALVGESLTPRMIVAAAVILAAVVLVITAPHPPEETTGQPVVPD